MFARTGGFSMDIHYNCQEQVLGSEHMSMLNYLVRFNGYSFKWERSVGALFATIRNSAAFITRDRKYAISTWYVEALVSHPLIWYTSTAYMYVLEKTFFLFLICACLLSINDYVFREKFASLANAPLHINVIEISILSKLALLRHEISTSFECSTNFLRKPLFMGFDYIFTISLQMVFDHTQTLKIPLKVDVKWKALNRRLTSSFFICIYSEKYVYPYMSPFTCTSINT